jgi:hypothetical protein
MTPSPTNATFAIISSVLQHGAETVFPGRSCSEIKLSGTAHGPAGGGASTPIGEIDRRTSWPI